MRRKARPGGGRQIEVEIEAIGARGDGIATYDDQPVFVPFTVAGDRVRLRIEGERAGGFKGEVLELIEEGSGRRDAPCPHFGLCGGCSVQHLEDTDYAAWKQGLVGQALARRGLPTDSVQPLVRVPPATRRRTTLAAIKQGSRVQLGFHRRESHAVVDLSSCLLLTPAILQLLPALRAALQVSIAERQNTDVTITEAENGADVLIVTPGQPDLAAREALAAFADSSDLARLSWQQTGEEAEPIAQRRAPRLTLGGVAVEPPPGAFLQPSRDGEAALIAAVLKYLPADAETVADLYAGCGTFTFPLAKQARVHAVEGQGEVLGALWTAARRADLTDRISVEERDLARSPVTAEELEGGDCVVFDPPRAGAREQAIALAESNVPVVIAVSCNPGTFARDARILVDGGYVLREITPVDQFPWSGHLELVACFARP